MAVGLCEFESHLGHLNFAKGADYQCLLCFRGGSKLTTRFRSN